MFDRYSVLDMFGPIYGDNWHGAEISDGLSYRWTDPGAICRVRLPSLGAHDVRIRLTCAFQPQEAQLDGVRLKVFGREAETFWSQQGPYASLWTDVHLTTTRPDFYLYISSPERRMDVGSHHETRALGLAISMIEVFALNPEIVGQAARDMAQKLAASAGQLEIVKQDKQEILSSTSWKITSPIRQLSTRLKGPAKG